MDYRHEVERNGAVIAYQHYQDYDARWHVSRRGSEVGSTATFTEACVLADGFGRAKKKGDDDATR